MTDRPPPMTDPDADLTSFKDMPLEVVRFRGSDLVAFASAEGIVAALMLWGASWHSRPAGSLTNDDRSLMRAAGYSRGAEAQWQEVREDALRGWVECSDGKLYHPVVAEKVAASWLSRLKQLHKNYGSAVRMHNSRNPDDKRDTLPFEDWLEYGRPEGPSTAKAAKQPGLPLPTPEASDPPARARPDARAGAETMPNGCTRNTPGCCAQHDEELRATEGDVTRLNPTKGREGKGREGIQDTITPLPPKRPEPSDEEERQTFDIAELSDALARLGGVSNLQPSRIAANMDVTRKWVADGLDIEKLVKPTIERVLKDSTVERIASLAFFDSAIRKADALAKQRAKSSGSSGQRTGGAKLKSAVDSDDSRIALLRTRLKDQLGSGLYGDWLSPGKAALALNGRSDAPRLVVTAPSEFAAEWIRKPDFAGKVATAVQTVTGSTDFVVTVEGQE